MNSILALDFGGTKPSAALAAPRERRWRARPAAIGVSFGGRVITQTNTIRLSHHMSGWEGAPLWHAVALAEPALIDTALEESS